MGVLTASAAADTPTPCSEVSEDFGDVTLTLYAEEMETSSSDEFDSEVDTDKEGKTAKNAPAKRRQDKTAVSAGTGAGVEGVAANTQSAGKKVRREGSDVPSPERISGTKDSRPAEKPEVEREKNVSGKDQSSGVAKTPPAHTVTRDTSTVEKLKHSVGHYETEPSGTSRTRTASPPRVPAAASAGSSGASSREAATGGRPIPIIVLQPPTSPDDDRGTCAAPPGLLPLEPEPR